MCSAKHKKKNVGQVIGFMRALHYQYCKSSAYVFILCNDSYLSSIFNLVMREQWQQRSTWKWILVEEDFNFCNLHFSTAVIKFICSYCAKRMCPCKLLLQRIVTIMCAIISESEINSKPNLFGIFVSHPRGPEKSCHGHKIQDAFLLDISVCVMVIRKNTIAIWS